LRFEGAKYIFRGQDFVFVICLKTNFLGATKFGVTKDFGGIPPEILPWL